MKALLAIGLILFGAGCVRPAPPALSTPMQLTSPAFGPGQTIPALYTCDGKNVSPPLTISDVPSLAQSLVLIMDDPDAPVGVWDHWVAFNLPPDTRAVAEGANPVGVMGKNTRGATTYTGPCPPDREHRYFFKLYALDALLTLPAGASKQEVERAMQGHVLASAELMGRYDRKR